MRLSNPIFPIIKKMILPTLMMETVGTSETYVCCNNTAHYHNPECIIIIIIIIIIVVVIIIIIRSTIF